MRGAGTFVRNRGQSKDKVVLEEVPAKPAHVFTNMSYQIQSEFNNSVLKKLKDALEADTSKDHSSLLEEGIELIKQRNKLLVISNKYRWETGVAYMLDPIAEDSNDERRIKKARKEAKLLKEKKKQLKSKRMAVGILKEEIYQKGKKFSFGRVESFSVLSPKSLSCLAF